MPPSCLVVQGSDGLVGLIWLRRRAPPWRTCACAPRDFPPPRLRDARCDGSPCTTRHACSRGAARRGGPDRGQAPCRAPGGAGAGARARVRPRATRAAERPRRRPPPTSATRCACRDAVAARVALGRVPRAAADLARLEREVEGALAALSPRARAGRAPAPTSAMRAPRAAPRALAPAASHLFGARGARPIFLRLEALLGDRRPARRRRVTRPPRRRAARRRPRAARAGGNVVPLAPAGSPRYGVEVPAVLHVLTINDGRGGASSAGYVGGVGARWQRRQRRRRRRRQRWRWAAEEAEAEVAALCGGLRELVAAASLRALAAEPLTGHVVAGVAGHPATGRARHAARDGAAQPRAARRAPAAARRTRRAQREAGLALTAVDGAGRRALGRALGRRGGGAGAATLRASCPSRSARTGSARTGSARTGPSPSRARSRSRGRRLGSRGPPGTTRPPRASGCSAWSRRWWRAAGRVGASATR